MISFRAAQKTKEQLDQLRKVWGENSRSRVIIRCIDWVWLLETGQVVEKTPSAIPFLQETSSATKQKNNNERSPCDC